MRRGTPARSGALTEALGECQRAVEIDSSSFIAQQELFERRRYGYVFGDVVTGRDGEIIFGENDNGGHVWLYFPRIMPKA